MYASFLSESIMRYQIAQGRMRVACGPVGTPPTLIYSSQGTEPSQSKIFEPQRCIVESVSFHAIAKVRAKRRTNPKPQNGPKRKRGRPPKNSKKEIEAKIETPTVEMPTEEVAAVTDMTATVKDIDVPKEAPSQNVDPNTVPYCVLRLRRLPPLVESTGESAATQTAESTLAANGVDVHATHSAAFEQRLIKRIVAEVYDHDEAYRFHNPVPLAQYPDYPDVIKNPVDLGMVKSKMERGEYKCVAEVLEDMDTLASNCRAYFLEAHQYGMALPSAAVALRRLARRLARHAEVSPRARRPHTALSPVRVAEATKSQLEKSAVERAAVAASSSDAMEVEKPATEPTGTHGNSTLDGEQVTVVMRPSLEYAMPPCVVDMKLFSDSIFEPPLGLGDFVARLTHPRERPDTKVVAASSWTTAGTSSRRQSSARKRTSIEKSIEKTAKAVNLGNICGFRPPSHGLQTAWANIVVNYSAKDKWMEFLDDPERARMHVAPWELVRFRRAEVD